MSVSTNSKFSTKNNANIATKSFPTAAEGTRFLSLADLIITAPTAKPVAVINQRHHQKNYLIG